MDTAKKIYLDWNGRISRKTYWIFSIPIALLYFAIFFMGIYRRFFFSLAPIIYLLTAYPSIMLNIKRAHDRNRSGLFTLLLFLPLISLWPAVELGFLVEPKRQINTGHPMITGINQTYGLLKSKRAA